MTITVTAKHIANGRMCNMLSCPVALALEEATGSVWRVKRQSIVNMTLNRQIHTLPAELMEFINDFDSAKPVSPFTFEIEI